MRIDLPNDLGWIEVKDDLTWADEKRIENASIALTVNAAGETVGGVDLLEQAIATITTAVISWSHDEPPTRETLLSGNASRKFLTAVERAVDQHYAAAERDSGEG